MPIHVIYVFRVSVSNIMQLSKTLLPEAYGSQLVCAGEDLFFERMPLHSEDGVIVSFEFIHSFFHLSNVEQLDFVVSPTCEEVYAIDRVPLHLLDGLSMCLNRR